MDSTELHYVTYDPEEIWTEMQKAYVAAGGDILYSGDEKEMLLRSVQAIVTQAFAGVDNALRMATLRYAVGSYLDLIGELRGCYRIEAAPATMTVAITTATTGSATTLSAGAAMTADGEIFFLLAQDRSEAELIAALQARYETPEKPLARDVKKVLETLRAVGALDE